jgi:hypothetical protein
MEGFIILVWVVCGIAGYAIGNPKGHGGLGLFLGLVLGVFGLLIICFVGPATPTPILCPHCKGQIHPEASVCPHCRTTFAGR